MHFSGSDDNLCLQKKRSKFHFRSSKKIFLFFIVFMHSVVLCSSTQVAEPTNEVPNRDLVGQVLKSMFYHEVLVYHDMVCCMLYVVCCVLCVVCCVLCVVCCVLYVVCCVCVVCCVLYVVCCVLYVVCVLCVVCCMLYVVCCVLCVCVVCCVLYVVCCMYITHVWW